MRGTLPAISLSNLSVTAQQTVSSCKTNFPTYHALNLSESEKSEQVMAEKKLAMSEAKSALAQIDAYYRKLNDDLDSVLHWLKENHDVLQKLDGQKFTVNDTPTLTHLKLLRMDFDTRNKIRSISAASESKRRNLEDALLAIRRMAVRPPGNASERIAVCCHLCSQKINLPKNRIGNVICPGCKYEFIVSTMPVRGVEERNNKGKKKGRDWSILSLVRRIFRHP